MTEMGGILNEYSGVFGQPSEKEESFVEIEKGDARDLSGLIESSDSNLEKDSVDCIITSPPYWQKRDYGFEDQIGQEEKPEKFIKTLIHCFEEWKKVLKPTGSVFLNIGDTYRNRSLVGIPERLMEMLKKCGWLLRNKILWAKSGGMPDPSKNRLANRHEYIFHLTQNKDYYYDLFGYSKKFGSRSNPGDVWEIEHDRNTGDHLAPFPEEIVERSLALGCPLTTCSECGGPFTRDLKRTTELDKSRPQARRAMEIYEGSKLTEEHIRAVQSVGISDAGKAKKIQGGSSRNAEEVQELAEEAKEVLGGYFREFTFPKKETIGWSGCDCESKVSSGVVFDPFMGSGTTLEVATRMGYSSVGIDLDPPSDLREFM